MNRMKKADFENLLEEIRNLPEAEKAKVRYWAKLAEQRRAYGKPVYVHKDAPDYPECLTVWNTAWGRTTNEYHRDVQIGSSAVASMFGEERCWQVAKAAK